MRYPKNILKAHLHGFISGVFGEEFDITAVQCLTDDDEVCSLRVAVAQTSGPSLAARIPDRGAKTAARPNF
jgi:hypothetical protein